ncbi:MFS transporter [Amycolatopsis oliviviridis]|uniref:ABC transporter, permease protein n=1 Tax=Amycolatopsis oliviviridis TaxID=1471590 RepID=A0ABQ3L838_9PSEU|nr:MFS transporter [Amycolatopsis oliviviridis]GHH03061.1 putative ABC transporter, permease protein [Amycolatopsis oliviviridis]
MKGFLERFRSFDRPSKVLMVNQFTINVGFYMLMPYLAGYLSGPLGLAGWAVGLVLGIRNFSQQGMFLVGGTLADRFGYKPLIVAGCVLRTAGFALLSVTSSLPSLIVASAATGFAGALFNPAVRAYLAADAGERRLEAFSVFNVFYQGGILAGPVVGLALTAVDFRLTCLVAAAVFGVLTVVQVRALPAHESEKERSSIRSDWRVVTANRPFLLFALVMIGSYVLSFQTYLALPMEARRITGSETSATVLIAGLFVISGGLAIAGQLKITAWFKDRWSSGTCLAVGMVFMAAAFVAPLTVARAGPVVAGAGLLVSAALLAVGTVVVFPFEMDTVVRLSGDRLVATHYGFYNTIVGVGILLGNLFTGTVFDLSRRAGLPEIPWLALTVIGVACAAGLRGLDRSRLQTSVFQ